MKKYFSRIYLPAFVIVALILFSNGCKPSVETHQTSTATPRVLSTPTDAPPPTSDFEVPYELISQDSLLAYLEDLTSIQAYSGWRNSASSGEAEALDYIERTMRGFSNLQAVGLEFERQSFDVYLATEILTSDLTLTIGGQQIEVQADAIRGNRFDRHLASYFDSDGAVNDSNPNPLSASGVPLLMSDADTLYELGIDAYKGKILFLDYTLIDQHANSGAGSANGLGPSENSSRLLEMVDHGLAGIILVTSFSNKTGQSHGMGASEGSTVFGWNSPAKRVPILYVRIEDLGAVGIKNWDDLTQIESAQLTVDADVYYPGKSGNLIARIPGVDSSKAIILGAHVDSPNNPGALDDGSGSAALLEIARVLNVAQIRPPVDLYLAWFGSEELGVYGSSYFASTHQELLDHTLVMLQMDGLGSPLDGVDCKPTLVVNPYDRFGEDRVPLYDFLADTLSAQNISLDQFVEHGLGSDNNNFEAFNVPNADLAFIDSEEMLYGSRPIHYYVHWHDPYDDMDRARFVGTTFVDMTKTLLAAALEIGRVQPNLRVTPEPTHRALLLASHTEAFGITALRELGMAFSWEGLDVDLIPYGQAITTTDLQDVKVVVLPPTVNSPGHAPEAWSDAEITLLQGYVANGGLLVVINSASDYTSTLRLYRPNLGARSANAVLESMGIKFRLGGAGSDNTAQAISEHPLTLDAPYLTLSGDNAVAFSMTNGLSLIRGASHPLVGLVDYGPQGGQILVIAELGLIKDSGDGAKNMQFIKNIAHYASTR